MWLTWTNQQYYLLQRTLFSHFTNTLRQFLWNVLHFVFQFIHIFWHWKQKEIADLTFFENAPKRAFACVKKRDVYTLLEKRNKCILISVKWYDCCCIKKKSVKKKWHFSSINHLNSCSEIKIMFEKITEMKEAQMWYFEHANCKCNINEKCEFKVVKLISMTFEISSAFSTLGNELRNVYTCI